MQRILLKLSGEALAGEKKTGFDEPTVRKVAFQVKELVDAFIARGFTYFDTAWMYCAFQSEHATREALVARYPRESYILTDKLSGSNFKSEEELEQEKKCHNSDKYYGEYLPLIEEMKESYTNLQQEYSKKEEQCERLKDLQLLH